MGVIYKITNNINGKVYIGQTIRTFSKRINEHINLAMKEDTTHKYAIHNAIKKYGVENFSYEIIEKCSNDLLDEKEKYWIDQYDSYCNGYNETLGGDNAEALLRWQKNNKDIVQKNALNGLKYANDWKKNNPEQSLEQIKKAQALGAEATRKRVRCVELNIIFNSLSDAERWSVSNNNPNNKKAAHQHISKVCKGQRKTAGGYRWEYI